LSVVVLDAGHGGTDSGARGESGIVEKEVTLLLARAVQAQLEQQGFRVVLTRQADEGPTIDERAAMANAQHGAVFISLHVSSIGTAGTAMAFYMPAAPASDTKPGPEASGRPLVRWQDAQQSYAAQSRKLAELIQVQLGQKLRGSAEVPQAVAVRQLRSVTSPAVAVELSSVAVADRKPLDQVTPALAEAVARAVAAFKAAYEAGVI
ncbi:MAG: N-acetylmuramoyl-L-alanine amidase, partial [Acidobacteria bacterium]|nr:N-acetylmuramoyl-L-alanine amidase [Acidobacteriota bacterium]